MQKLLTQKELCFILCVSEVHLWKYRKKGLPYIKIGTRNVRYDYEKVIEWLDKFKRVSSIEGDIA